MSKAKKSKGSLQNWSALELHDLINFIDGLGEGPGFIPAAIVRVADEAEAILRDWRGPLIS
jgi:hypothetical protein